MDMTELDAMTHGAASLTVMVGIPCYNEEVAIGSLVLRVSRYADQVVVLDDGSTDKTAEVARLAGAHVLVHDANIGRARRSDNRQRQCLGGDCAAEAEN